MNNFTTQHTNDVVEILNTAKNIADTNIKRLVTISAIATATKHTCDFIVCFNSDCRMDDEEAIVELRKQGKRIIDFYMTMFEVYEVDIALAVEYFDDIVNNLLYSV